MAAKPLTFSWNDQPAVYCDADTINEKISQIEKMEAAGKIRKIAPYISKNFLRLGRTYYVMKNKFSVVLRVYINADDHYQYIFNMNRGTSVTPEADITGQQAYLFIEELFKDVYGNKTLYRAFSGTEYKQEYNQIKLCIPKPVSMINPFYKGYKIKDVWKADTKSAYPNEGSKSLPTLHGCKSVKGIVKPTEEYPFAFYIHSHHMAIYNEFDTHDWWKLRRWYTLYDEMFVDYVPEDEEITVLCKRSTYSLKPIFMEVYRLKEEEHHPVAKLGMNAAIGYFQRTSDPRLSHLAAVIIGRCADRMLKIAKSIEDQKRTVLLIATDSIIWIGGMIPEATDLQFLGSFSYEIHGGQFFGQGSKAYQVINDIGECITKYSGMKNSDEKNNMKFGEIPSKVVTRRYIIDDDGKVREVNWAV